MYRFFSYLTALTTLCLTTLVAAASTPTTAPTYATPNDVLSACQRAMRSGDNQTFVDCYSPEAKKQATEFCLDAMVVDAPPASSTDPMPPAVATFNKKYGLDRPRLANETDDQFVTRLAGSIKDQRTFLVEALGILHSQAGPDKSPPSKLINVNISSDGTTAVAKLVRKDGDGSAMTQDVKFRKIDGSWKLNQIVAF